MPPPDARVAVDHSAGQRPMFLQGVVLEIVRRLCADGYCRSSQTPTTTPHAAHELSETARTLAKVRIHARNVGPNHRDPNLAQIVEIAIEHVKLVRIA